MLAHGRPPRLWQHNPHQAEPGTVQQPCLGYLIAIRRTAAQSGNHYTAVAGRDGSYTLQLLHHNDHFNNASIARGQNAA